MGDLEFQKKMALQFYYMGFYTNEQLKQFVPYLLNQDDYNTAVKNKHPQEQNIDTPQ